MVKCMQKAYDYGIYASIKASWASSGSLAYYFPAFRFVTAQFWLYFNYI